MRTVDTNGIASLSGGEGGPFRLDEGRLLKTTWKDEPLRTEREAEGLFRVLEAACAAGEHIPRPLEVVATDGGYGLVIEYVAGADLGTLASMGVITFGEAGAAIASAARAFHARHTREGLDWKAQFVAWADGLAPRLAPRTAGRLGELVRALPDCDTLLHGDLHAGNVVRHAGHAVPIDCEFAGFGHPAMELAKTRTRLFLYAQTRLFSDHPQAREDLRRMWAGVLVGYFEGWGPADIREADRRIAVLSYLECACSMYRLDATDPDELVPLQLGALKRLSSRYDEELPGLARLDFPA